MKTTFHLGAAVALLAAALAPLGAAAQSADEPVGTVLTFAGTPPSASFTRAADGLFVDTFSFQPATASGPVSVTLTSQGPLTFFAALLGGDSFVAAGDGAPSLSFTGLATADAPLGLTVFGFAGDLEDLSPAAASYTGSVTLAAVAPIPEPATYALMLGGLALLAAATSRRRRRVAEATPH